MIHDDSGQARTSKPKYLTTKSLIHFGDYLKVPEQQNDESPLKSTQIYDMYEENQKSCERLQEAN